MKEEVFVALRNVSKQFKGIQAVDNLSLKVFKGDVYGFLGPNGAGKSTSIRMILSLISPTSGQIQLFGKDLAKNRYQTLSRIGALVEKPDFYKYLSARKNLEILGNISNVSNLGPKIDEVLELVGLTDRAGSKVKTYSQGMRQRLGIAQSLLHDPDLIVLDEPANGLDPQGQKEMRNLIRNINEERGITILLSSHILSEIEDIATRMVIINKGRSVVEGKVDELLDDGEMKVSFEVNDVQKGKEMLEKSEWKEDISSVNGNKILLNIHKNNIPQITARFIENGIDIYAVKPLRSLEEYFIKITSNA